MAIFEENEFNKLNKLMESVGDTVHPSKSDKILFEKKAFDGKTYAIIQEGNKKFAVKSTDNQGTLVVEDFQYIGGDANKHKLTFENYQKALKNLNTLFGELRKAAKSNEHFRLFENLDEKYVIKKEVEDEVDDAPIDDEALEDEPSVDDMGDEDVEGMDADTEDFEGAEDEPDPKKRIQKLSGKLGYELGEFQSEEENEYSDLAKYAINSVISRIKPEQVSEEDKEAIIGDVMDKLQKSEEEKDMGAEDTDKEVEETMTEAGDSDPNFENIIFMQDSEADKPLKILRDEGVDAALDYLKQWHDMGNHERRAMPSAGSTDKTYEKDGYILSWNEALGYIGLEYDLDYDNTQNNDEIVQEVKVSEILNMLSEESDPNEVKDGNNSYSEKPSGKMKTDLHNDTNTPKNKVKVVDHKDDPNKAKDSDDAPYTENTTSSSDSLDNDKKVPNTNVKKPFEGVKKDPNEVTGKNKPYTNTIQKLTESYSMDEIMNELYEEDEDDFFFNQEENLDNHADLKYYKALVRRYYYISSPDAKEIIYAAGKNQNNAFSMAIIGGFLHENDDILKTEEISFEEFSKNADDDYKEFFLSGNSLSEEKNNEKDTFNEKPVFKADELPDGARVDLDQYIVKDDGDMTGEEPFELNGKTYQYVWGLYPVYVNDEMVGWKRDIAVYSSSDGDFTFGYRPFRTRHGIDKSPSERGLKTENDDNNNEKQYAILTDKYMKPVIKSLEEQGILSELDTDAEKAMALHHALATYVYGYNENSLHINHLKSLAKKDGFKMSPLFSYNPEDLDTLDKMIYDEIVEIFEGESPKNEGEMEDKEDKLLFDLEEEGRKKKKDYGVGATHFYDDGINNDISSDAVDFGGDFGGIGEDEDFEALFGDEKEETNEVEYERKIQDGKGASGIMPAMNPFAIVKNKRM